VDELVFLENDLEERLYTTINRCQIALTLVGLGVKVERRSQLATILEDLHYGTQVILEHYCVDESI